MPLGFNDATTRLSETPEKKRHSPKSIFIMSMAKSVNMIRCLGSLRPGGRLLGTPDRCRTKYGILDQMMATMTTTVSYKLLIIGGGSAGTVVANKFAGRLGKGHLALIEPSEVRTKCVCSPFLFS